MALYKKRKEYGNFTDLVNKVVNSNDYVTQPKNKTPNPRN